MEFKSVLKRFMSINRDYIPSLLAALFFLVGNQGLVAYINYTAGNLTDAITSVNFRLFGQYILILILMQVFHLYAEYQVNYRVNYLSESFVKRLRIHTYGKITAASMRWLDENKLGDIVSRINGDLNALVGQVNTFMTWQLSGAVTFLVYMTACFLINWKLTLIGFAIVPVLAFFQFLTGKPIAKLGQKRSVAEGEANGMFMDLVGGLSLIKIFRAEKELSGKYGRQVEKTVSANVKSFALEFIMNPLQILMGYLPNIIILIVGSRIVLQGEMTVGMLFSYILLSSGALDTVSGLSWQVRNIYDTIGISKRIFEIWDIEEEKNTGTVCEKKNDIPVQFEKVCFGYYEGQQILHEVFFTISEGENVAVVGASGSGKSTVMKLLSGFYEKDGGSIKIYGSELDDWNKEKLREHMSYVGQDTYLFPVKHRNDKRGLMRFIEQDKERIQNMDEATLDAVSVMLSIPAFINKGEDKMEGEEHNLCKALTEWLADERKAGIKEGERKGRKEGREEGETRFASLTSALLTANRISDLTKAASDAAFRESLYREFAL